MNALSCNDPDLVAALRECARGRASPRAAEHLLHCEWCRKETQRLRRVLSTFEAGKPSEAEIERAWRRFEGRHQPQLNVGVAPRVGVAWALASVVIVVVLIAVGWQVRERRRAAVVVTAPVAVSAAPSLEVSATSAGDLARVVVEPVPSVSAEPSVSASIVRPEPTPNWVPPQPSRPETVTAFENEMRARRMLEPRVWSGKATEDEVKMLRALCRHQKDSACVARATSILAAMTTP